MALRTLKDDRSDTWSRRSLRMLRTIANATVGGGDDSGSDAAAAVVPWKMESCIGPGIGSVGRASVRRRNTNNNGAGNVAAKIQPHQRLDPSPGISFRSCTG